MINVPGELSAPHYQIEISATHPEDHPAHHLVAVNQNNSYSKVQTDGCVNTIVAFS